MTTYTDTITSKNDVLKIIQQYLENNYKEDDYKDNSLIINKVMPNDINIKFIEKSHQKEKEDFEKVRLEFEKHIKIKYKAKTYYDTGLFASTSYTFDPYPNVTIKLEIGAACYRFYLEINDKNSGLIELFREIHPTKLISKSGKIDEKIMLGIYNCLAKLFPPLSSSHA